MQEYSLRELQKMLKSGETTSRLLIERYLERIELLDRNGPKLNSVACINPDVLAMADRLDAERRAGKVRGPLHGIPVLLKDNIGTHDRMPTTASSFAFADFLAPKDAHVARKLRQAGMILLGKTNLSEFAYFMSTDKMPSGYGSLNGQVKHPYNEKIDPLGSSTGSAVAVAANLIPVAVGTETNGSLTAPAKQNLIVTIKPTLGLVSRSGIIPISHLQDTAGPLARTVEDAALLLTAMAGSDQDDPATKSAGRKKKDYAACCGEPIQGLRIGMFSFANYADDDVEKAIMVEAKVVLEAAGAVLIPLVIEAKPMKNYETMLYDFKYDMNRYLAGVKGHTAMTSLSDIIAFNEAHAERCLLHGQNILIEAEKTKGDLSEPEYVEARKVLLEEANRMTVLMKEQHLDALIAAKRTGYAPVAGNPCMSVPARPLTDLIPRSLNLIGRHWDECTLIKIAYAYEQATRHRHPPVFPDLKQA